LDNTFPFSVKKTGSEAYAYDFQFRTECCKSDFIPKCITISPEEYPKSERTIGDQLANHYLLWKLKFTLWFLSKLTMNSEGFTLDPSQNLLCSSAEVSVTNQGAPKTAILKGKLKSQQKCQGRTGEGSGENWGRKNY